METLNSRTLGKNKMNSNLIVILAFLATGCVSLDGGTKSEWGSLQSAKQVSCIKISKPARDISAEKIVLAKNDKGQLRGLLLLGVGRLGEKVAYFHRFEELRDLDKSDYVEMQFGNDGAPKAIVNAAGRFVSVNSVSSEAQDHQVRDVEKNIVLYKPSFAAEDGDDVELYGLDRNQILMRVSSLDAISLYDLNLDVSNKKLSPFFTLKLDSSSYLFKAFQGRSALMSSSSEGFNLSLIRKQKRTSQYPIKVTFDNEVESYDFAMRDDGIALAYVDGDSLVGETKIRIAKLALTDAVASLSWQYEKSMGDAHLDKPQVFYGDAGARVAMMGWLDGEGTIFQFEVKDEEAVYLGAWGVFSTGSRIDGLVEFEGHPHALIKTRKNQGFRFELCRL